MTDLPPGWRWASVDELAGGVKANVIIGPFGSSLKVSDYRDSGVPLVFVRNIRSNDFGSSSAKFISEEKARDLRSHQVIAGDVLVTKMGDPPGDAAVYAGPPAVITADCIRLRVGPKFHARFVALAFGASGVRRQIAAITRGVAQKKVSLSRFRQEVRIPVPSSFDEQRRIVDILEDHLSRLDSAEGGLERAARRLTRLQDRLLVSSLLGSRVNGRRQAADLLPAGTDDGALKDLPEGWSWQRLRDLAEVVGGVTKDAKLQSDPAFVEIPYLRVANVQRGRLDLRNVTTIRVSEAKASTLRLKPGDVLLNEGGDRDKLARGWIWEGQIDFCIHQNHVFRARVRNGVIDPMLLSWAANTIGAPWAERNGKQSTNLASISLSKIRLMPIPVPPRTVQPEIVQQITDQARSSERLSVGLRSGRARSGRLRLSLLDAAFSGRLTGRASDMDLVEEMAGV